MKNKILINQFSYFYEIAIEHFVKLQKLTKKREKLRKRLQDAKNPEDLEDELFRNEKEIDKEVILVIVFSALTLEGFINDYGFKFVFSQKDFERFEKYPVICKLWIFPQIKTGKWINTKDFPLQDLLNLFSLRNRLVHSKTKRVSIGKLMQKTANIFFKEKEAKNAIQTLRKTISFLKELDSEIDISWMVSIDSRYAIKRYF